MSPTKYSYITVSFFLAYRGAHRCQVGHFWRTAAAINGLAEFLGFFASRPWTFRCQFVEVWKSSCLSPVQLKKVKKKSIKAINTKVLIQLLIQRMILTHFN